MKVTSPALLTALSQRIDSSTRTNGPSASRCQWPTSTPQISRESFSAAWAAIRSWILRSKKTRKSCLPPPGKAVSVRSRFGELGNIQGIVFSRP